MTTTQVSIELPETCQWFALCERATEYAVSHPVLGLVACCARCAAKLPDSVRVVADLGE